MNAAWVHVRVPATTANLGPGFDALGLALEMWNEAWVRPSPRGTQVRIAGEGRDLPLEANRLVQAIHYFYQQCLQSAPPPLEILQYNRIPPGSGLGSSATATVAGLLAASALSQHPLDASALLNLAVDLEGHADNAAAALLGGLVVVLNDEDRWIAHRFNPAPWRAVVTLPQVDLPTHAARAALPRQVSLEQAVYNLGRTALVVQALIQGNLPLLRRAMQDRLHQPYRLPLIPGAAQALEAAQRLGAAAALSGAGPSVIAFTRIHTEPLAEAMQTAFEGAGLPARTWQLHLSPGGATWEWVSVPEFPPVEETPP